MKYFKIFSICGLLGLLAVGCESPLENERLDEFSFEKGGYMRIINFPIPAFSVSKANLSGTKLEVIHEAVTPDKGSLFSSYDLVIRFVDNTPANGTNNVADKAFRSIPASSFTADAATGYPRATMTVTGQEALTAVGLTDAQIAAGDRFEIRGTMKLSNGKSFSASNTGANITGGAFYNSPFFYRVSVVN
jgi:hypothetical protein